MQDTEKSRVHFQKVYEDYLNYIALYRLCNSGSVEGITSFEEFYWRQNYQYRYEDPERIVGVGY